MDVDMEREFASPKRRKLFEPEDDNKMIDIRGPPQMHQRAADVEIPVIDPASVVSTQILQFGHSEEDKAQVAELAMKKSTRNKLELAQDAAERELQKQNAESSNQMQL